MINKEDIEKYANLSRIKISDEEKDQLYNDFESILAYVSEIQSVSCGDAKSEMASLRNVFREDVNPHESGMYTEALLAEVPQREGEYVKVKKIL